MSKPEKQKMATSQEVYHRIIWDKRLNRNTFIAGYQERLSSTGIREKPLAQWASDGDIPWHRIRYIRCGDIVVWDRDKHLDLISSGELPDSAWVTEETGVIELKTAVFDYRGVYKYNRQGWEISNQSFNVNINTIKVVSFNVLCNLYAPEKIHTNRRIPAIIGELERCNADIIAIEEATPDLLELLLLQDWVRDYFVSESGDGNTLKPYGNLLLSRFPFTLVEHRFSGHKRVLVGTWQLNHQPLHVAVVHLTSDRAENAVEKRRQQLSTLLARLHNLSGDCLIVGDFNTRGNEQEEILTRTGFIDVWDKLHPYESGFTFDPANNPLAALMSLHGQPARFDRILFRGDTTQPWNFVAQSIEIFANEPIPGSEGTIYPSDHFGVGGVFNVDRQVTTLQTTAPIYQSAIVIIPPDYVLPAIQTIRHRHDAKFERWMPHITLIYGFLPESHFADAVKIITPVLAKLQPFSITLSNFETFTHRRNSTAWLKPVAEPENALQQLQAVLQNLFPQCDEQSKKSHTGFTPHLSVGQFPTLEKAFAQLPQWHPISFTVDSIALISRRGNEPFQIRQIVRLGNTNNQETVEISSELIRYINELEPQLTPAQQIQRDTVLEIVRQACIECLGTPPSPNPLQLLGSARLGVQSPNSDIDAVCLIPNYISAEVFLSGVQQRLQGIWQTAQLVLDARVPLLRMKIENISLDLLYAHVETANPQQINLSQIDPISLKAIIGCWEADFIADIVTKYVSIETYRLLLRAIRAWAKSRCIYGNAWGFLGGFSWALLSAWTCTCNSSNNSIEALIANFFQLLSQQDWSQPIALSDAGKSYHIQKPRDWLPIITSIAPCQNTARNITRSTAQIIQNEFKTGAAITQQILAGHQTWATLFTPVNLNQESDIFLAISTTSQNQEQLEKCCGLLEGYIIGLIIQLEKLNIFVRPATKIHQTSATINLTLGLKIPDNCDLTTVEQLAQDFFASHQTNLRWNISIL